MERRFDVFVSHHSEDKPWVLRLVADLGRHGVSVWLDENEIRPGDLFVNALERGLEQSGSVALVVSPESRTSGWIEEEHDRAIALAKRKDQPLRLVPLLLRTDELPRFLAGREAIAFRDAGQYAESVRRLVWAITGKQPAEMLEFDPNALPPLPGEEIPGAGTAAARLAHAPAIQPAARGPHGASARAGQGAAGGRQHRDGTGGLGDGHGRHWQDATRSRIRAPLRAVLPRRRVLAQFDRPRVRARRDRPVWRPRAPRAVD